MISMCRKNSMGGPNRRVKQKSSCTYSNSWIRGHWCEGWGFLCLRVLQNLGFPHVHKRMGSTCIRTTFIMSRPNHIWMNEWMIDADMMPEMYTSIYASHVLNQYFRHIQVQLMQEPFLKSHLRALSDQALDSNFNLCLYTLLRWHDAVSHPHNIYIHADEIVRCHASSVLMCRMRMGHHGTLPASLSWKRDRFCEFYAKANNKCTAKAQCIADQTIGRGHIANA